ncbi:MAG TPA: ribonucleotide reductase N-terminal alpha domain-containing protein, partial [Beutenbergiaceae bacterium]|nr:ribonucleotide reductase N-terminal alpha domain-containing protein [Beutenbergiaceae bacterium]
MNNLTTQPHLTGKEKTFTPAAQAIVKRQYLQEGERTIQDMFHRVANWVAEAETEHATMHAEAFYNLMNTGRFSPGGRVLAGAGTSHGNGLNCFVQDGSPHEPGTTQSVLALAKKLALVTKVGGGNGLNLDPIPPKRLYSGPIGRAYITINPDHPDHDKVQSGTFMDLVTGQYVTRPYDHLEFISHDEAPEVDLRIEVPDSVEGIWDAGAAM